MNCNQADHLEERALHRDADPGAMHHAPRRMIVGEQGVERAPAEGCETESSSAEKVLSECERASSS